MKMADKDEGRNTTTAPESTGSPGPLDKFFEITARGSTIRQEIRGGLVAFVAMAYIVVLNPLILGGSEDVAGGSLDFAQLTAVTGLVAGVITILFGVVARLPFALAAGLGMNSFLAVSVVQEVTWADAMGLVVINGVIIVILGATGIRTAIFNAVPHALKVAITVGIGLFIAFIGFVNSGFVTRTPSGPPVQLGQDGSIASLPTLVFVVALILIGILVARNVPGGILIGIVVATILAIVIQAFAKLGTVGDPVDPDPLGWNLAAPEFPKQVVAAPDFSLVGSFDLIGGFQHVGVLAATMLVFTLVFTNFFDAMGTMTGLARSAGLQTSDGMFPRIRGAFVVEGLGAVAGGGASASSNTVFVDAAAGIAEGCEDRARRLHHRSAVPAVDVLLPAHRRHPDGSRSRSARRRRSHDGHSDPRDRHERFPHLAAGLPHHGHDAADLLDRQRHRRRIHLLGAHPRHEQARS